LRDLEVDGVVILQCNLWGVGEIVWNGLE